MLKATCYVNPSQAKTPSDNSSERNFRLQLDRSCLPKKVYFSVVVFFSFLSVSPWIQHLFSSSCFWNWGLIWRIMQLPLWVIACLFMSALSVLTTYPEIGPVVMLTLRVCCEPLNSNWSKKCECVVEFPFFSCKRLCAVYFGIRERVFMSEAQRGFTNIHLLWYRLNILIVMLSFTCYM